MEEVALTESTSSPNSSHANLLIANKYKLSLTKLFDALLEEYGNSRTDFSRFISNFFELMQEKLDPPIDTIWVYAKLCYQNLCSSKTSSLDRISGITDLFQLISACSASCSSLKSIALLAPVVFEAYRLSIEAVQEKELHSKKESKIRREVLNFVEVILGYVGLCHWKNVNEENGDMDCLVMPLMDLVRIWMEGNGQGAQALESFFPLVSEEVRRGLAEGGKWYVHYLAGVVTAEVLLLKICLKLCFGIPKVDLEKEMRSWAVGSISAFQSFFFFEILVTMLLEPTLPLMPFLNAEDGVFLRKLLYDALILVEYSFLNPQRVVQLPVERVKNLAIKRLILAQAAVEFSREIEEPSRAASYINGFSNSHLPSQLMKWVTNQIGVNGETVSPNGSSPKAILRWLLDIEDRGIRLLESSMSRYCAKYVLDLSKADRDEAEGNKPNDDLQFFIDNKGERKDEDDEVEEVNEAMSAAFMAAARAMKPSENDNGRKRKKRSSHKKKQNKVLKYNLDGALDSGCSLEGLNGESEVENPSEDV